MKYKIEQISQEQSDVLLKKLVNAGGNLLGNFELAFHDEKGRKKRNEKYWSLPPEERIYYIVSIDENDLLLAGINNYLNISSFAKVNMEERFNGKGRYCVKKLIEDVLVDKNRSVKKMAFAVVTVSESSIKVFEYLMKNLPKGIKKIKRNSNGFTLYLS